MPIINPQDAREVDQQIDEIFDAKSTADRLVRIRQLFVGILDFRGIFDASVDLRAARGNVKLPSDAYELAQLDDVRVVYVDMFESEIDTDRVNKREAQEAARLIGDDLGDDLLLVFTNRNCEQLHIVRPSFEGRQPALRRMVVEKGLPRRTLVQQISNIWEQWRTSGDIRSELEAAFDVEAVTRRFFDAYKKVFSGAMEKVTGFDGDHDAKNLYVQTLFNRLMFVYFISRKGWLRFNGEKDYLNALFESYSSDTDQTNFYTDRLTHLFFAGLNNPASRDLIGANSALRSVIGDVPFLNGGLFDKEGHDKRSDVVVPDDAIEPIFRDLFDRFNFTVMESTPFDEEVAVDPEMLGKVFEEMVTGRHESGSYYTPRRVVSFMCREALKGYLAGRHPEIDGEAIRSFVEDHDTSCISEDEAPAVGQSLVEITVVDPACGSGAYLLGMMQELVDLRSTLYSAQLKRDAVSLYRTKLSIIERNLYGADIDDFAVNIAMLRLWLSLVIEYEGDHPEPLPNLDYKIVCGDTLLGADPSQENGADFYRHETEKLDLRGKKARYMRASDFNEKQRIRREIDDAVAKIRVLMGDAALPDGVVDWPIDFADVFALNDGFDVVVANPPYVRQEKIGPTKPDLRKEYADSTVARSDLYCYFYVRGLQLLRAGGMHVFVCSNSWLDVGYGAKLQEYLLRNSRVDTVYESAVERQFSTAQINTIISVLSRTKAENDHSTKFVSLRDEFETAIADATKRREITMSKGDLRDAAQVNPVGRGTPKFVGDKWGAKYLRAPDIYRTVMKKGVGNLLRLGDLAKVRRGITSGANDFFYLTQDQVSKWGIEDTFLQPMIKSPRESDRIQIDVGSLPHKAFTCHRDKQKLRGTAALDYINWGESQGYNRKPSLAARNRWWDLGQDPHCTTATNIRVGTTSRTFYAHQELMFDKAFYEIDSKHSSPKQISTAMNSSLLQLMINVFGRVNLGGGVLEVTVYEFADLLIVDPSHLPELTDDVFKSTNWDTLNPSPERRVVDDAVFDVLSFTQGERDGVYEGVWELVENRQRRARSV